MEQRILDPKNDSKVMAPELRGNTQMPPGGCYNMKNKNVLRAGHMHGGYHASMTNTESQTLGPKAGYMGVKVGKNCGTVNPHNLGASKQVGGGCGCSGETASYGFVGGDKTGSLRGSYAPIEQVSNCSVKQTGGKAKKSRKYRKHKASKKSRKYGKSRKHKASRKSRKYGKLHKASKHGKKGKHNKKSRKVKRKHRKGMRGGYQQLGTDRPFGVSYTAPIKLSPSESALANQVPIKRVMHGRDNYNHYTGKGSLSPILDQAAN